MRDRKLVCTGVIFTLISGGAALEVLKLDVGSPTEMGPGFFPLILSILLAGIGLTTIAIGIRAPVQVRLEPWPVFQTLIVIAGVFCFAGLIESRGLVPAVTAIVLLACVARLRHRMIEVLAILAVMLAMSIGIFVYGIQLPIALW